jgi:hypothetical protein
MVSAGTVDFTMVGAEGCDIPSTLPPGGAVVEVPPGQSAGVPLASGLSNPFNLFVGDGVLDYTETSADRVTTAHTISLGTTD